MVTPVVLCGGVGSRLWPLSRRDLAKQFVPLLEGETLFQRTLRRFADKTFYARPLVVSGSAHRFAIAEQAEEIGVDAALLLEPEPRDTLAAITAAAAFAVKDGDDPILLIAPSDHLITDVEAFTAAVGAAAEAAAEGKIVTFGVEPSFAATGYGYIRPSAGPARAAQEIAAFIEKPDEPTAHRLISEGCLWNAGLFCFQASTLLEEVRALKPDVLAMVDAAVRDASDDLGAARLGDAFAQAEKISLDYAIMENTERAAVIRSTFAWSDIGDWRAIWRISEQDSENNAQRGDVMLEACDGVLALSQDRLVCGLGLKDVIIVDTPDALLVADRSRSQDVKGVVAQLSARERPEATTHARVHRPWGWYQAVDKGERFKVKRIVVAPNRQLSLQLHHHRAEHWVVVKGTASVTIGDDTRLVRENESVFIPMGARHRLANPGRIPVEIIEVQTGAYLEEDDIVRLQDDFGRSSED